MITKNEIKRVIDSYIISESKPRKLYTDELLEYMERKEIIVLKGIRRSGKSTIMFQLIENLGIDNCVYVNLDDYRFLDSLNLKLLERILEIYKFEKKIYMFFDEIQNIDKFESFLRTHYDLNTNIKFIISGSNSSLLTKELGTLLTGRSLTFEILPLTYKEFNDFSDQSFEDYLKYGGFPEVVLEKDPIRKRNLLVNYFDMIVEKDIIQKNNLVNHRQLKEMLKYFMLNPGIRISANKLSKQLGISINTIISYLNFAQDVYLIFEVPFFSYSAKTKFIQSKISKYYCIDNGFNFIFNTRFEKSKLFENSVALKFFKKRDNLYYWFGKNEVDFIIDDMALNVVSSKDVPEREFLGLKEIKAKNYFLIGVLDKPEKNMIEISNFLLSKY